MRNLNKYIAAGIGAGVFLSGCAPTEGDNTRNFVEAVEPVLGDSNATPSDVRDVLQKTPTVVLRDGQAWVEKAERDSNGSKSAGEIVSGAVDQQIRGAEGRYVTWDHVIGACAIAAVASNDKEYLVSVQEGLEASRELLNGDGIRKYHQDKELYEGCLEDIEKHVNNGGSVTLPGAGENE